jgi:hypothetical protein
VSFSCRLDEGPTVPCTGDTDHDGDKHTQGEIEYDNLSVGRHCFYVFAVDRTDSISPTTTFCWSTIKSLSAAKILALSGTPQFTVAGTVFASPLVARVTDSGGLAVSGAVVTFSAPASGASALFASCPDGNPHPYTCVVITNTLGIAASPLLTANDITGSYRVSAKTPGVGSSAAFSLINSAAFSISGNIIPRLYPGASQKLNLSFTNPNSSPIVVAPGGVAITITTSRVGCTPSMNFAVTKGLTATVVVPAGSTKSLAQIGISPSRWPVIKMIETNTNQDACEGAPLTLHYSGDATG